MDGSACRICGGLIRDHDDVIADGDAHAACVEAHVDDRRGGPSPMRRFFQRWWGAGHH